MTCRESGAHRQACLVVALDGPSSLHAPLLEPSVMVSVSGRHFPLPEIALSAGLSDLRLATGEHVGMQDYATGVALVLTVLERLGVLTVHHLHGSDYGS